MTLLTGNVAFYALLLLVVWRKDHLDYTNCCQ